MGGIDGPLEVPIAAWQQQKEPRRTRLEQTLFFSAANSGRNEAQC